MKVLFLHPDDSPLHGSWVDQNWDLIVDLGFASSFTYAEWSRELGARVLSIRQFQEGDDSRRWIGQLLAFGRGQLLDRWSLDWWELLSVLRYQDLEGLYLIQQLSREIHSASVELFATRPHPWVSLMAHMTNKSVTCFQTRGRRSLLRAKRFARSFRQFALRQLAEIAWDKWDPRYELRRHLVNQRANAPGPVVLLPSAYSNVTRTVLAYATAVPNCRFLLATTRRNAVPPALPDNVIAASLAAYAVRDKQTQQEIAQLTNAWCSFRDTVLAGSGELRVARDAGIFESFPKQIQDGLFIRDAWLSLLRHEPVTGVVCADDLNYYTRLPLALAAQLKLNAVYCSHGALDSALLFKKSYADVHLVKSDMEKDYVLRSGAVSATNIVVAAPPAVKALPPSATRTRDKIVFFSQPYEVSGGRTTEIYRELLPRLCAMACASGKRVVIKLHPFESIKARKRLLASILPRADFDSLEIVAGVLLDELIDQAWCGIGIDSSVAVECTRKGIPFFLCQWLDFAGDDYMNQFARYGAGILLQSPEAITGIPELVGAWQLDARIAERLWHDADPGQLESIFTGASALRVAAKFAS